MNYKINEEEVFSDITDGIAVIINSGTGIYYGMNAFSTNIYENIINGVSTEKIISAAKKWRMFLLILKTHLKILLMRC